VRVRRDLETRESHPPPNYSLKHKCGVMHTYLSLFCRFDLIISNPPYADPNEMRELPPEYCHEPELALIGNPSFLFGISSLCPAVCLIHLLLCHAGGGFDGLDLPRRLIEQVPQHLTERGVFVCEVTLCSTLSALCSLLSTLCSLLFALCSSLSALCSLLFTFCSLPSALCCLLYALYDLLSALCLPSAACCLLSNIILDLRSTIPQLFSNTLDIFSLQVGDRRWAVERALPDQKMQWLPVSGGNGHVFLIKKEWFKPASTAL
jgi:hypothetical protein